jgi:hypothetical protein
LHIAVATPSLLIDGAIISETLAGFWAGASLLLRRFAPWLAAVEQRRLDQATHFSMGGAGSFAGTAKGSR